MGVAACLQWERHGRMTGLTTTHRHDYRWPGKDCLIPKAEAALGDCEARARDHRQGRVATPCGTNPPPAPPPTVNTVCRDLVPTPVDRPWCQRGPLVPLINPPPPTAPTTVRTQPQGCQVPAPAPAPGCNVCPPVVSARVGAAPHQDSSRFDQPNQYLSKLCDKYPRPTAVIAANPRDELMRRVYTDRYRTTYQSDYCRTGDDTARLLGKCDTHDVNKPNVYNNKDNYDSYGPDYQPLTEGMEASFSTGRGGCPCGSAQQVSPGTKQSAGDPGGMQPPACRPAAASHHVHFSCCSPKKSHGGSSKGSSQSEEVGPPKKLPPWITEYSDSIGKTGQLIMDQRLHHPSKKKKLQ